MFTNNKWFWFVNFFRQLYTTQQSSTRTKERHKLLRPSVQINRKMNSWIEVFNSTDTIPTSMQGRKYCEVNVRILKRNVGREKQLLISKSFHEYKVNYIIFTYSHLIIIIPRYWVVNMSERTTTCPSACRLNCLQMEFLKILQLSLSKRQMSYVPQRSPKNT